jgi:DNA-binding transcriptional LysR family regulator
MAEVRKEGKPKNGVDNVNIRNITFETDIQRIRSLKEKLDDVYVDRKTGNIEPQEEVAVLIDEIKKLLVTIIQADAQSKGGFW